MLKILYLGDVVSLAGRSVLSEVLPRLINKHEIDGVIAQSENVSGGRGMTLADMRFLQNLGVDAFTGGNWSTYQSELIPALNDPRQPVCGPANYLPDALPGYKYVKLKTGAKILVISLLGRVIGRNLEGITHPLSRVDEILAGKEADTRAVIVNLHGDFSSEKRSFGYYLDGQASLVVGDHWHIPTADAMILPDKTAHITDVGMCGSLHSSLGVSLKVILERWQTGKPIANVWDEARPWQFNSVLVEIDDKGLACDMRQIQEIVS